MVGAAESAADNPVLTVQASILGRPASNTRRMADAIRVLAIDAVEAAKSGHPGMPMGMADCATVLWTKFLKFDAADPRWPDRDRFVLSAGHGSMLLYALLHLTGHAGMGLDDLRRFRQLHSPAAGAPVMEGPFWPRCGRRATGPRPGACEEPGGTIHVGGERPSFFLRETITPPRTASSVASP